MISSGSSHLLFALVQSIEAEPLNSSAWQELLNTVKSQKDPLSTRTLEVVVEGVRAIEQATREVTSPRLPAASRSVFVRLAKAYNSPTLLREAGLVYLQELSLPEFALHHFERSLRLGGPERELRPLLEAASLAVQANSVLKNGSEQQYTGVTAAQPLKPFVPNGMTRTGRLLLPALAQATTFRPVSNMPRQDAAAGQLLPATTLECLDEARQAILRQRFQRAEVLLEKADVEPADSQQMWQVWTDLGQACYEAGFPLQVQTAFLKALKYGPREMASHFNVALGLHLNERHEEALASYLKANQLEPKHPKVWCNLGVLYFQMQQYALAESALRYATVANPDYARAWDNLAAALGAQDKLDEALEACQRAIELRPDYPESHFKMGVIRFSRNEYDEARRELQRAALLPSLAAFADCLLAMIHARLEQTEEASASILQAIQADSKCELLWMAWNDLGLAYYAKNDFAAAALAYGEATMIKPDEAEAWFNLGVSYHRAGDLPAARDAYQQAVDLRESMSGAWHNLGIVCGQTHDNTAAMNAFRQEVIWAPDNVRAWYDLGVTLEKLGRREEAKAAFSRVEALSPRKLARTARILNAGTVARPAGETLATKTVPHEPMTPQRLAELS